jgi:di/tricarboxylate transporter
MITFGKFLQAIGIAETLIGLIAGLQGSMGKEMLFVGIGIFVFIIGRWVEKMGLKRAKKL